MLLATVKVLLASFLLVLLHLVLARASLRHVNDDDCSGNEYCVPDTAGAPPGAPGAVPGQADTWTENVIINPR